MAEIKDTLLLEFIFKQKVGVLLGKQHWPVQSIPFDFGLKITNKGDKPFPGATILSFAITHQESAMSIISSNQLLVSSLNPLQSTELWVDTGTSEIQGALWLSCSLKPFDDTREIETLQRSPGTNIFSKYSQINTWGKIIYIQPRLELLQARTNILVFILTVIVFVDSLIGIKVIAKGIVELIVWVLSNLANLLSSLVK